MSDIENDVARDAANVNRRATWLALAIAIICVLGLVGYALTQTLQGNGTAEGSASGTNSGAAGESATDPAGGATVHDDFNPDAENAAAPQRPECPVSTGAELASDAPLKDVNLPCLGAAGQGKINVGKALAGKPAVVNVWSWNCAPCRNELPIMEQWAAKNPDIQLVGVQAANSPGRGAAMLADLDVGIASYQDSFDAVGPALALPRVVPITVVLHADGTVAKVLPQEFTSVEMLDTAVREALR